jgi:hypothetical protein
LGCVRHFRRLAFFHLLKQFPFSASEVAHRSKRLTCRRTFVNSLVWPQLVREFGVLILIQEIDFSKFFAIFWLIIAKFPLFDILDGRRK